MKKDKFFVVMKENGSLDIDKNESGEIRRFNTIREADLRCEEIVIEGKGEYTCYICGTEVVRPYEAKVGRYQTMSVDPIIEGNKA